MAQWLVYKNCNWWIACQAQAWAPSGYLPVVSFTFQNSCENFPVFNCPAEPLMQNIYCVTCLAVDLINSGTADSVQKKF